MIRSLRRTLVWRAYSTTESKSAIRLRAIEKYEPFVKWKLELTHMFFSLLEKGTLYEQRFREAVQRVSVNPVEDAPMVDLQAKAKVILLNTMTFLFWLTLVLAGLG